MKKILESTQSHLDEIKAEKKHLANEVSESFAKIATLEDELADEEECEDEVEAVEEVGVPLWLVVDAHGEGDCVEDDGEEHRVLAQRRRREGPELVLDRVLGDVELDGAGVQREFYTVSLILIQRTVLEICFTLRLEGHDNKTDEDVDHEECEDDDVDEVE